MKVKSKFLEHLHLDKNYNVLPGKSTKLLLDYFKALDMHRTGGLNDIQFYHLLRVITDLTRTQIYLVFDMLDTDSSGEIDFNEFYLLMCILIAVKDKDEKQFIHRHSRTVFDLLDEDGSNSISATEFGLHGFLFGFQHTAIRTIFHDFDVSGDQELDFKEFRMFAMACIDKQEELARLKENNKRTRWIKEFLNWFRGSRRDGTTGVTTSPPATAQPGTPEATTSPPVSAQPGTPEATTSPPAAAQPGTPRVTTVVNKPPASQTGMNKPQTITMPAIMNTGPSRAVFDRR